MRSCMYIDIDRKFHLKKYFSTTYMFSGIFTFSHFSLMWHVDVFNFEGIYVTHDYEK